MKRGNDGYSRHNIAAAGRASTVERSMENLPIRVDDSVPNGNVHFVDSDGRIVGRIINCQAEIQELNARIRPDHVMLALAEEILKIMKD